MRFFTSTILLFIAISGFIFATALHANPSYKEPVPQNDQIFSQYSDLVGSVEGRCKDDKYAGTISSGFVIQTTKGPLLISNAHGFYDKDGLSTKCVPETITWRSDFNALDPNLDVTREESFGKQFHFDFPPINHEFIERDFLGPKFKSPESLMADITIFAPKKNQPELRNYALKIAKNWTHSSVGAFRIALDSGYLDSVVEYVQTGCKTRSYGLPVIQEKPYQNVFLTNCIANKGSSGSALLATDLSNDPFVIGIMVASNSDVAIIIPIQNLLIQLETILGEGQVETFEPQFVAKSEIMVHYFNCQKDLASEGCKEKSYSLAELSRGYLGLRFRSGQLLDHAAEAGHPEALLDLGLIHEAPEDPILGVPVRDFKSSNPYKAQNYALNLEDPPLSWAEKTYFGFKEQVGLRSKYNEMIYVARKQGYEHDPVLAADYFMAALEAGNCSLLLRDAKDWDLNVAKEMQRRLFEKGFYQGELDGAIGKNTKLSIAEFSGCD